MADSYTASFSWCLDGVHATSQVVERRDFPLLLRHLFSLYLSSPTPSLLLPLPFFFFDFSSTKTLFWIFCRQISLKLESLYSRTEHTGNSKCSVLHNVNAGGFYRWGFPG